MRLIGVEEVEGLKEGIGHDEAVPEILIGVVLEPVREIAAFLLVVAAVVEGVQQMDELGWEDYLADVRKVGSIALIGVFQP